MTDKSKIDKSIEKKLAINVDDDDEEINFKPMVVTETTVKLPETQENISTVEQFVIPVSDIEDDYMLARENITKLTDTAQTAIEDLLAVCKDTEEPRAYEALSKMIDVAKGVNMELMNLHNTVKKITDARHKKEDKHVTNNTTFVGSTMELMKAIEGLKNQSK